MERAYWAKRDRKYVGCYNFTIDDVSHRERLTNKFGIRPESLKLVSIEYLIDRNGRAKYILKDTDCLLEVGGKIEINSTITNRHGAFIRSESQIRYLVSTALNGRYNLLSRDVYKNTLKLTYEKTISTLPPQDNIKSWSFGIITNGKRKSDVDALIKSILDQSIENVEIIVCGNHDSQRKQDNIITIPDIENKDGRGPISKKKNAIIKACQYNNVLILHDRYQLPLSWYTEMIKYGNYFDMLAMPNISPHGKRVNDWCFYLGSPDTIFKLDTGHMKYGYWNKYWYSQGGVLLIKKHLYEKCKLDDNLCWEELEDIQFSQRFNLMGGCLYFDDNNKLLTKLNRMSETKSRDSVIYSMVRVFKSNYSFLMSVLINMVKYMRNTI